MNRITNVFFVLALLMMFGGAAAQDLKFGHINGQELLMLMPERDSAEAKLRAYGTDLSEQIEELHVEYNNKLQTFMQRRATLSDAIREARERELGELQQRIQEFEMTAQQDYQRMQGELMQPLIEKAERAIERVGKANGFTYVFDTSVGSVVYFSDQSIDVMPLVKKEMNITR